MATLTRRQSRRLPFLAALLFLAPLAAADLEYQVKAAFLLNFTKFVEWPSAAFDLPESPITICILGDDPFGTSLDQIVSGEVVNGRKVAVQRIKQPPPAKSCQVVFETKADRENAKNLAHLGPGVLTVGDNETFLREGGMIAFTLSNHRVQFEINQTTAETAGLKVSSKLLSVARAVGR